MESHSEAEVEYVETAQNTTGKQLDEQMYDAVFTIIQIVTPVAIVAALFLVVGWFTKTPLFRRKQNEKTVDMRRPNFERSFNYVRELGPIKEMSDRKIDRLCLRALPELFGKGPEQIEKEYSITKKIECLQIQSVYISLPHVECEKNIIPFHVATDHQSFVVLSNPTENNVLSFWTMVSDIKAEDIIIIGPVPRRQNNFYFPFEPLPGGRGAVFQEHFDFRAVIRCAMTKDLGAYLKLYRTLLTASGMCEARRMDIYNWHTLDSSDSKDVSHIIHILHSIRNASTRRTPIIIHTSGVREYEGIGVFIGVTHFWDTFFFQHRTTSVLDVALAVKKQMPMLLSTPAEYAYLHQALAALMIFVIPRPPLIQNNPPLQAAYEKWDTATATSIQPLYEDCVRVNQGSTEK